MIHNLTAPLSFPLCRPQESRPRVDSKPIRPPPKQEEEEEEDDVIIMSDEEEEGQGAKGMVEVGTLQLNRISLWPEDVMSRGLESCWLCRRVCRVRWRRGGLTRRRGWSAWCAARVGPRCTCAVQAWRRASRPQGSSVRCAKWRPRRRWGRGEKGRAGMGKCGRGKGMRGRTWEGGLGDQKWGREKAPARE